MKVEFKQSFARDLRRIKDKGLLNRVKETIEELEQAQSLSEVQEVRKLRGEDHYYRIRIGDYRRGIIVEGEVVTLVKFLHRRDIYRYFP